MMKMSVWQEMNRYPQIREILESTEFLLLDNYNHHGRVSRRMHCIYVAAIVFYVASKRDLDFISATRGALLHDFFFYRRRSEAPRLHVFRHPAIALNAARRRFSLNEIEEDAILRHMWPLTPVPPRYPESALVSRVDKLVALRDFGQRLKLSALSRRIAALRVYAQRLNLRQISRRIAARYRAKHLSL